MELREYFMIVKKYLAVVVLLGLLGLVGAYGFNQFKKPTVTLSGTIYAVAKGQLGGKGLDGASLTQATTQTAAVIAGWFKVDDFKSELYVKAKIKRGGESFSAKKDVAGVVTFQIEGISEVRIKALKGVLTDVLVARLDKSMGGVYTVRADSTVDVEQLSLGFNLFLGLMAGLVLGLIVALVGHYFVKEFVFVGDVRRFLRKKPLLVLSGKSRKDEEKLRLLRALVKNQAQVLIASSGREDDSYARSLAVDLASQLSLLGQETLFVNADLENNQAIEQLGAYSSDGLVDFIGGRSADELLLKTNVACLRAMSSGMILNGNAYDELAAADWAGILARFGALAKNTVLKLAPLGSRADGFIIVEACKAVVLVVKLGRSRIADVVEVYTTLKNKGIAVELVVVK